MTPTDAANLLIAVNASPTGRLIPATIERFRAFRQMPGLRPQMDGEEVAYLSGVLYEPCEKELSFGESLDALIAGAWSAPMKQPNFLTGDEDLVSRSRLDIEIEYAEEIYGEGRYETRPVLFVDFVQSGMASVQIRRPRVMNSSSAVELAWQGPLVNPKDREVRVTISDLTIRSIAKVIFEN